MTLEFKPIALSDEKKFQNYLFKCPQVSSDYSFLNIWSWASVYDLDWAWTDDLVWLRQRKPSDMYWAPVGDWQTIDWQQYFSCYPQLASQIIRVPEQLARLWESDLSGLVTITEDRDQYDYIYNADELIRLKGNRFHKKKNLVNQFKKKYEYQYVEMTPHMVEKAGALQEDWCSWRECDSDEQLANENQAIGNVFDQWENLSKAFGGCIMADDLVIAYTIGEMLTPDTLVVHFEKGCIAYKGVYQAINQLFLENLPSNIKWVNREQDLGDEGLRKSKVSYHPARFLKKYRVALNK